MPRGDGTGPAGMGSRTGRGMGYCAGYPTPGFMNPGFGGRGGGLGRGMGWRRFAGANQYPPTQPMYFKPMEANDEKKMLSQDLKALEEEMKAIKNRLGELEK